MRMDDRDPGLLLLIGLSMDNFYEKLVIKRMLVVCIYLYFCECVCVCGFEASACHFAGWAVIFLIA